MANRFVRDMLHSRYGGGYDGRNPYGSRGGYVTSRSPRRDRAQGMPYNGYPPRDMRNMYDTRNMPMPYDMNGVPYDGNRDYGYNGGYDGNYDMRGRDYGEEQYGKLSREDMEKWKHGLENADGSHGEHFKPEQLEQLARQMNIDIERMGGMDVFCMAVNMMYADYCGVARKYNLDRPEYYIDLAKAFLEDKDFHGNGEEKLWLYYKCIVSDD